MPPLNIPFPLSTSPGAFNQESNGRLINCYAEPLGKTVGSSKGNKTPLVTWRKSPGMSLFAAATHPNFRGGILVGGTLYTAWTEKAATFTASGTETVLAGNLAGTDRVFWAHNNRVSPAPAPDIVCVSPASGAFVATPTAVSTYPDIEIGAPNSVGFMDGYFIFTYGSGRLLASKPNSTDVDNASLTGDWTVEQSKPGGLLRGVPFNGQYFVWGPNHGAVYSNTAQPTGFPFSRSYVIQRGLYGRYAVAGHENGFGSSLIWVADDASVVRHNGTPNPTKISSPDLDRLIEDITDRNSLEASVYISQGHPKWVLSCPTFTWEFDIGSEKWNERASYLVRRWRGISGILAFNKWITGDTKGNRLLFVDDDAFDEYLEPLIMVIESGPVTKFPNRTKVARSDFNFVTGVGRADGPEISGTDPSVGISWSNDGGFVWGEEKIRRLGRQSEPTNVVLLRSGQTMNTGRRWRLKVSGEVYASFLGGSQNTDIRNG
jgi:hypothetical protein